MRAARVRAAGACKSGVRGGETAAAFHVVGERDIGSHLRPRLTPAGPEPNFCRAGQEMVNSMTKSIRALLSSAAHSVVRGLAVVALVVVWSVGHIGTYALTVVGVSSAVLTTTAAPADAWWRCGGCRGRDCSTGGTAGWLKARAFRSLYLGPRPPPGLFHDGITVPIRSFFPYRSAAAMLPPSTVVTSPVVFSSSA